MSDDQESLFGENPDHPEPRATKMYRLGDNENYIGVQELKTASPETQTEVLRKWFFENYEDPVESTPYDSEEGGYQFIWGGPYDARDELQDEFSRIVPDEVIDELANELESQSSEWAPNSNTVAPDIDEFLFDVSAGTSDHYQTFQNSILNIQRLMEVKVEAADYQLLLRMLYAGVITALETYLSDRLISSIENDPTIRRKFVEKTPELNEQKVPLPALFDAEQKIDQAIKAYLSNFVWHRLEKVRPMYHDTLDINFPPKLGDLFSAVRIRHDLIHRGGKTQDGKEHLLNVELIKSLIESVDSFISFLEGGTTSTDDDSPF